MRDLKDRVTIRIWKDDPSQQRLGHVSIETYRGDGNKQGINQGSYASFWPKFPDGVDVDQWLSSIGAWEHYVGLPGANHASLEEDINAELTFPGKFPKFSRGAARAKGNGRPDYTIEVYDLDINKINATHQKFLNPKFFETYLSLMSPLNYWLLLCSVLRGHKKPEYRWSLFGSSIFGTAFFGVLRISNCSGLALTLLEAGGVRAKQRGFFTRFLIRLWRVFVFSYLILGISKISGALLLKSNSLPFDNQALNYIFILGGCLLASRCIFTEFQTTKDSIEIAKVLSIVKSTCDPNSSNFESMCKVENFVKTLSKMMCFLELILITDNLKYFLTTPGHIFNMVKPLEHNPVAIHRAP